METVELAGSLVATAWTVFIEETEKMVRVIKDNAEMMAATTLEKLNALYTEKKTNRKQYQEEYGRIAIELHRLQEAVVKTRQEYDRCLENYIHSKAKLEQASANNSAQPKRLEEARERYQVLLLYDKLSLTLFEKMISF